MSTGSSDDGLEGKEHSVNRIDRLLGLILLLQSRRVLTAEEMAVHFELSVRTIYRDLAALSEIGVPIAAEAGVGYSLLPGYHLPPLMFSQDEASALLIGGEMVKQFTDDSASASASSALLKIRAVLPRAQRDQVERLSQHLVLIGVPQRPGSPERNVLLPVQQAIVRRRVLHLVYRAKGRQQPTARDVEPRGVVFYSDTWYLIAWCRLRQGFRHFRLDRIEQLAERQLTFEVRPGFSLRAHLEQSLREEKTFPARIRFSLPAAERARSECFAGLVEERAVAGGVEMDFLTFSFDWLAKWLLSFGGAAEALAPDHLRDLVKTEVQKVLCLYALPSQPAPHLVRQKAPSLS